jgi:hypothetical protein
MVFAKSTHPVSPTLLHAPQLPQGQQKTEPRPMESQTGESKSREQAQGPGAKQTLAPRKSRILKTRFP